MNPANLYYLVREKEGRLYPDEIVMRLPYIPSNHPHSIEWLARAEASNQLIRYLSRLNPPLRILELGCGNGWLSHAISKIIDVDIWGLDRASAELTQASRLFSDANTGFLSADIFHSPFAYNSFDLILLGSVIQYFPDLALLMTSLNPLLTDRGEIHIIDSPIYNKDRVDSARERTLTYYRKLGFPEMANHYFHHSVDEIASFSPCWLYRPNGLEIRLLNLFGKIISPFPWLCIQKIQ